MQNTILKSFETFIREPLSFLKGKIMNVVSLKNEYGPSKNVKVDILNNSIQVNVVNSERMFNLLSTVVYKKKMNRIKEIGMEIGHKKSKIPY